MKRLKLRNEKQIGRINWFSKWKIERVEAGHTVERYTCKICMREQDVDEHESGSKSDDNSSDSENEERSDGCGLCQQVVEENIKLKEENDSVREVIAVLKRDLEELKH